MLSSDVSAMGAKVVMGEVEKATTSEAEGSRSDDADQPQDPANH